MNSQLEIFISQFENALKNILFNDESIINYTIDF